jgi:hypothetical protein
MWSSWIGKRDATHVMYIAKLRDGSKRVKKIQNNLEEGLRWKGREKIYSHKKI